jgi:hypothetical protein
MSIWNICVPHDNMYVSGIYATVCPAMFNFCSRDRFLLEICRRWRPTGSIHAPHTSSGPSSAAAKEEPRRHTASRKCTRYRRGDRATATTVPPDPTNAMQSVNMAGCDWLCMYPAVLPARWSTCLTGASDDDHDDVGSRTGADRLTCLLRSCSCLLMMSSRRRRRHPDDWRCMSARTIIGARAVSENRRARDRPAGSLDRRRGPFCIACT